MVRKEEKDFVIHPLRSAYNALIEQATKEEIAEVARVLR